MAEKRKFFFDLNNFNDDAEEISEEELAFREREAELIRTHGEEIERIKKNSYEQGKKDGYEDSRQSLEQKIALLLESAKQSFLELQAQESTREQRYEAEANILALYVFKGIYPAWAERYGVDEIERGIRKVLHRASNQKNILVEVAPSLREEVEQRLTPLKDALSEISFSVEGKEDLSENDFRMKWEDGGAVRDGAHLAEQILKELQQELPDLPQENLAESAETRQNEREYETLDAPVPSETDLTDSTRTPEIPDE